MAISKDEFDLRDEVRLVLLASIRDAAARTNSYTALNSLAEAYAWVVEPDQAHGSSLAVKS